MSVHHHHHHQLLLGQCPPNTIIIQACKPQTLSLIRKHYSGSRAKSTHTKPVRRVAVSVVVASAAAQPTQGPLDLTEENVRKVLVEARAELGQLFDTSVGITGEAELADLDGPFVKIRLKGRFWHKRSTVLARLANLLQQRIPEILEVEIEDKKQLDDSPENF